MIFRQYKPKVVYPSRKPQYKGPTPKPGSGYPGNKPIPSLPRPYRPPFDKRPIDPGFHKEVPAWADKGVDREKEDNDFREMDRIAQVNSSPRLAPRRQPQRAQSQRLLRR